jgi:hypothetical protein
MAFCRAQAIGGLDRKQVVIDVDLKEINIYENTSLF